MFYSMLFQEPISLEFTDPLNVCFSKFTMHPMHWSGPTWVKPESSKFSIDSAGSQSCPAVKPCIDQLQQDTSGPSAPSSLIRSISIYSRLRPWSNDPSIHKNRSKYPIQIRTGNRPSPTSTSGCCPTRAGFATAIQCEDPQKWKTTKTTQRNQRFEHFQILTHPPSL